MFLQGLSYVLVIFSNLLLMLTALAIILHVLIKLANEKKWTLPASFNKYINQARGMAMKFVRKSKRS
jgi:hypothetical protein